MMIDPFSFTQIVAGLSGIAALFILYRLLVAQKDAVIQLLKERLAAEEAKIAALKNQTPDVLVETLNKRITAMTSELSRSLADGNAKESEINQKKQELNAVSASLEKLSQLIKTSDLVCPDCSAPLLQRGFETIYGVVRGTEVEADIEHREYECGAHFKDSQQISPCRNKPTSTPATSPRSPRSTSPTGQAGC